MYIKDCLQDIILFAKKGKVRAIKYFKTDNNNDDVDDDDDNDDNNNSSRRKNQNNFKKHRRTLHICI